MRALSNFLKAADVARGADAAEYRVARPDEIRDALALLLGNHAAPTGDEQVNEFLAFAAHRRISVADLWVIGSGGRMRWCILPIVSPGRTMLLLTPPTRPAELDVGPGIDAVCAHHALRGVHLAQALAEPTDAIGRQLYAVHGFREMAELLYLQTAVRRTALPRMSEECEWRTYSHETHELFAGAIVASYRQSLDCPALNGQRPGSTPYS